jgi:putative DNA primase/helicase
MLIGIGDNGKTVFVELLNWLLGSYASKIETELLMTHQRNPQGPSADIVALKGLRFVYANETSEGQRLADARIKELTGGDTLTGRKPYGTAPITFFPSYKLVLVGNHKPDITDNSSGMWSRVGLVPFDEVIPPEKRDRRLLSKLRAEGSGILNWTLQGYASWRKQGLLIPKKINAATQTYRDDQDIIGEWKSDHCNVGPGRTCNKTEAYRAYRSWAQKSGHGVLSQKRLTRRLTRGRVCRSCLIMTSDLSAGSN